jgi:predicted metal-dependent peptidase
MGFVYPGFKRLHVDKWLSARDTSASIDSECLSQFSGVINGILDYLPIDILDFDVDIQNGPKPFESPKAEHTVSGRGGTCFQPVIDKVDEMDYKGVIILTDGCAEAPTKPKHAQVIWLMPMGCTPPVDWGKVIYMNKYA